MNTVQPLKKPFNLNSPLDQAIIRRLVKSAQRRGQLHIHKAKKGVPVPRHKMENAA